MYHYKPEMTAEMTAYENKDKLDKHLQIYYTHRLSTPGLDPSAGELIYFKKMLCEVIFKLLWEILQNKPIENVKTKVADIL